MSVRVSRPGFGLLCALMAVACHDRHGMPRSDMTDHGRAWLALAAHVIASVIDRLIDRVIDRAFDRVIDRAIDRVIDRAIDRQIDLSIVRVIG